MINLDRNENFYGPAPKCFEILNNIGKLDMSIYSKAYLKGVQSDLSERLARDYSIEEKQVILGYGAEEILKLTVQAYLKEGDKLMVPSYSWWYYKKIAEEVGCGNVEYGMKKGETSFEYDADSFLEIYEREKPKVIFIASPNNPTGNSIDEVTLTRILDKVSDAVVLFDQAYVFGLNAEVTKNLLEKYPNVIIARTFSKYFALASMRIGYGLVGKNLTRLMEFAHRYLGFNYISEQVALAALDSPEYYEKLAEKMEADKKLYYNELGAINGFTVYPSDANFILVEIPKEIKDSLKQFLLERDIVIKFMNEELLNHHLRITIGTHEQNLEVIKAIKEFFA